MTAFNTATNTGSTTFTNSWGTVELLPSATAQLARGFARTSGWRYFEFYVDDAGGSNLPLLMGAHAPPIGAADAFVIGSDSKQAILAAGVVGPVPPYNSGVTSLTVNTGDTFMFAVDLSGTGRIHDGTIPTATLSSGGEVLTQTPVEVGKNGVWGLALYVGWGWPSHGYPVTVHPIVVRDSTSAATAKVSLRVVTTSFAYAIPAGMVAWDDGPEGGTTISTSGLPITWDPLTIGSDQTLTDSNMRHNLVSAGSTLSVISVKSTPLPTTGKRVVEFWGFNGRSPTQSLSASGSGGGAGALHYNIGICDKGMTSISWSFFAGQAGIAWGDDKTRRGVSKATSMTQVQSWAGGHLGADSSIFYIDFDNKVLWQRRGLTAANTFFTSAWAGRTISGSGPDPYIGRDGMTFSSSTTMRMIAWDRKDQSIGSTILMNVGQYPFETFPLLPGWISMDGSRQATGGGSVWDTSAMPASVSVCFSTLAVRTAMNSGRTLVRNTTAKSSGKWFFEIFMDGDTLNGTLSAFIGLLPATVATLTAAAAQSLHAVGLWYGPAGAVSVNKEPVSYRARYGATMSYTHSMTMTSFNSPAGTNTWWGCAVDFDAGKVWFGTWNPNRRAIAWAKGADPVTGTNPDMTFTASTMMYIAATPSSSWWYLVAESANVIGLPSGFTPWNGTVAASTTATPSAAVAAAASGVLWPYGVQT